MPLPVGHFGSWGSFRENALTKRGVGQETGNSWTRRRKALGSCITAGNFKQPPTKTLTQSHSLARAEMPAIIAELTRQRLVMPGNGGVEVLGLTGHSVLEHTARIFDESGHEAHEDAVIVASEIASESPTTDRAVTELVAVAGQPGVLDVALDETSAFQYLADTRGDPLDESLQFVRARGCHGVEHRRIDTIGQIHAIQKQHVKVDVQVQRGAKALNQRHRAGVAGDAGAPCRSQQMTRDRAIHHAQHPRERARVGRQQKPQRVWQRQHPLAQWPLRQYLIGQQRGRLGHASGSAGGAEAAPLAAECHEPLGVALLAAHAQEAFLQPPALQVSLELLLNVLWQRSANLGAQLMKCGIVPLDRLIQQRGGCAAT